MSEQAPVAAAGDLARSVSAAKNAHSGRLEVQAEGRASVSGALSFATVRALLAPGSRAIAQGQATLIDLGAVSAADSAGLALLIEWLSLAKAAGQPLRYENIPAQIRQLARLSELEPLLEGSAPPPASTAVAPGA